MRPHERLGLARQAYQRALASAREQPTRASWFRLLTASRNLKSAKADGERKPRPPRPAPVARPPLPPTRQPAVGRHESLEPLTPAAPPASAETASRRSVDQAAVPAMQARKPRPVPAELAREWERSRVLRERARELVSRARVLRDDLANLLRTRPRPRGRANR